MCCRPQYNWGAHIIKAYWVFFKTEEERRKAMAMDGRFLVSHRGLCKAWPRAAMAVACMFACQRPYGTTLSAILTRNPAAYLSVNI